MKDGSQTFCQLMDVDFPQFRALAETHLDGVLAANFTATEIKGVYNESHVRDLLDIKAQKFRGYRGFIIRSMDKITSLTDVWQINETRNGGDLLLWSSVRN